MLQYLPGFGNVTVTASIVFGACLRHQCVLVSQAGGTDDGSPINDFTEEPDDPRSPQMRLEAISPRAAAMCLSQH